MLGFSFFEFLQLAGQAGDQLMQFQILLANVRIRSGRIGRNRVGHAITIKSCVNPLSQRQRRPRNRSVNVLHLGSGGIDKSWKNKSAGGAKQEEEAVYVIETEAVH